ncbi:MAG TPA: hypothetical protein VG055_04565 [Planctomycetaceae bacterium]|jgi:hypothetical protein|nr:hypothetical protein [Planctomycetaceae bacterium]
MDAKADYQSFIATLIRDGWSNAILSCCRCDCAKGNRAVEAWKAALVAGLFSIEPG